MNFAFGGVPLKSPNALPAPTVAVCNIVVKICCQQRFAELHKIPDVIACGAIAAAFAFVGQCGIGSVEFIKLATIANVERRIAVVIFFRRTCPKYRSSRHRSPARYLSNSDTP